MLYLDCIPLDVTLYNLGEIEIDTILTYIVVLVGAEGFRFFIFITIVKAKFTHYKRIGYQHGKIFELAQQCACSHGVFVVDVEIKHTTPMG